MPCSRTPLTLLVARAAASTADRFRRWLVPLGIAVGLFLSGTALGQTAPTAAKILRDDGMYQNGGYWATPLAWLMVTVMQEDPARAARLFCDAVEDFQARNDINEWVNDNAPRKRGVRDYCASAAMPLAGARRLRAHLAETGVQLPPDLARRLDTVPLVGDQQFDSVLFWDACRKLADLFDASGQPDRAATWRRQAERVKGSLASLWDEKQGLFVAASERWPQPSIWGSVFAVYAGVATPDQARRIAR